VWGWIQPKVPSGDNATPTLFGLSVVTWLICGGLFLLWWFIAWQRRLKDRGGTPLIDPELFGNRQLNSGLTALLLQYLVMMGMFFTMPLFLSMVLGLSAFETGLHMVPLSLALVITAPAVPRVFPRASPRRIVQVGLVCMLVAALYLAARFEAGADVGITTVPFLLMGVGMGAMASQLGNVIVSAVPVARGGEAGGLQYTAQNLGSSLGTALIGGVVVAALGVLLTQGIEQSTTLAPAVKQQATAQVSAGVSFVSDAQLQEALTHTNLSAADQAEIMKINQDARLGALRRAMVAVALFVLLALFLSHRLPAAILEEQPDDADAHLDSS
jgi:predicted MFS family arabinose efflux permease